MLQTADLNVAYPSQAEWPLGESWWEQGLGWHEVPHPEWSYGERLRQASHCMVGYPACPYEGKSHQHDLDRTADGHVLTLFVDDPANQFGASLFHVGERHQTRSGGTEKVYMDDRHAWNDPDGDGHGCVDCKSDDNGRCDRLRHQTPGAVGSGW